MSLELEVSHGRVRWLRRPRNLTESKQLIQACFKYCDDESLERERWWLRHIHGSMIDAVVDSWLREVRYRARV